MDKIYFNEGDLVIVKRLPTSRVMLVEKVERASSGTSTMLVGVRCVWFNDYGGLEKHTFSTKDLGHYDVSVRDFLRD